MPAEIYINPEENQENKPHRIQPGAHAIYTSVENGIKYRLGIRCEDDDSHTDVFLAKATEAPRAIGRFKKKSPDLLFMDGNRDGSIFAGQQAEYSITGSRGKAVRLLIRHAAQTP